MTNTQIEEKLLGGTPMNHTSFDPHKTPIAHQNSRILPAGQRPDEGVMLQTLLDKNALSLKEILEVLISTAILLQRHHQAGQLHLSLSPEKIYVLQTTAPPDVPFGIDTLLCTDAPEESERLSSLHVGYAAPEQMRGYRARFDHRTDLFAIGAILFGAVMGESPYASDGGKRYLETDYTYDIPLDSPLLRGCDAILAKKLHAFFDQTVTLAMEARYEDDAAVITVLYDLCRYASPVPPFSTLTAAEYQTLLEAKPHAHPDATAAPPQEVDLYSTELPPEMRARSLLEAEFYRRGQSFVRAGENFTQIALQEPDATRAQMYRTRAKEAFEEGIAHLTLYLTVVTSNPRVCEATKLMPVTLTSLALSSAYAHLGRPEESLRYAHQGNDMTHKNFHALHPARLHAELTLGKANLYAENIPGAASTLTNVLSLLTKAEQRDSRALAQTYRLLARTYLLAHKQLVPPPAEGENLYWNPHFLMRPHGLIYTLDYATAINDTSEASKLLSLSYHCANKAMLAQLEVSEQPQPPLLEDYALLREICQLMLPKATHLPEFTALAADYQKKAEAAYATLNAPASTAAQG